MVTCTEIVGITGGPSVSEGTSMSSKEAEAEAKAAKARAKAMRPWWKKKRFILPLGLVALIAVIAIASSGGDDTGSDTATGGATKTTAAGGATETTATGDAKLFPGRIDSQREDQERNIGESAKLSGYTATVTSAGFQQTISVIAEDGYIVADVTIENRDDKAQPYNLFDWKLQTPGGQVVDSTIYSEDAVSYGDLVKGGKVSGKVAFEVGEEKGDFYIIYKPDPYDAARGIWKATA